MDSQPNDISSSAKLLQGVVSRDTWTQLQSQGLDVSQEIFWSQLDSSRVQSQAEGDQEKKKKNVLSMVSDKLSSIAESVDLHPNRYVVCAGRSQFFVTSEFGATANVWQCDLGQHALSANWHDTHLEILVETEDPDASVQFASFHLKVDKRQAVQSGGSPATLAVLAGALEGIDQDQDLLEYPLCHSSTRALSNSPIFDQIGESGIVWAAVVDDQIRMVSGSGVKDIGLPSVLAWRSFEDGLELLVHQVDGVHRLVFTVHEGVENLEPDPLAESVLDDERQPDGADEEPSLVELAADCEIQPTPRELGRVAIELLRSVLAKQCQHACCTTLMHAMELDGAPLLGASHQKVVIVVRDGISTAFSGDGVFPDLEEHSKFVLYSLDGITYLQLTSPGAYRLELYGGEVTDTVRDGLRVTSACNADPRGENGVVVVLSEDETAVPHLLHIDENGMLEFYGGDGVGAAAPSLTCSSLSLGSDSTRWTEAFGCVDLEVSDGEISRVLTASNDVLVALWEAKERIGLAERIQGLSLGEMYKECNNSRTKKFLAGIFGNYIVTQRRLEQASPLNELIGEIQEAPPGPLSEELEARFIERLSILEISRHQLGRWLERCALMYPHYLADAEREWLRGVFGDEIADADFRDQEAWKIHQRTRGELRQVQASMGRAMNEVSQNLQMIAFAFPEEVRCAALAATRRAADLAEKGAMLAAFGGIGGQLMLGFGRASLGDPLGFALVGAVGLSLVGKQLQKKAKGKEQRIRLRAYGVQALEWWGIALETALVMSLECKYSVERSHEASIQRDRKLLEQLPREELPRVQREMVKMMNRSMQDDLCSQFYEALPGGGVFGWQVVDQIVTQMPATTDRVFERFSWDLPGSRGKDLDDE